ncbi:MAG: hypothetical protein ACFE8E_14170 [Candidatus Hodarchaeota archaeon]
MVPIYYEFFITSLGHATIQFRDKKSIGGIIELNTLGYPNLVLKLLFILFVHLKIKKIKNEPSLVTNEFINLFTDEGAKLLTSESSTDIDFEYEVIIEKNNWTVNYTHNDLRKLRGSTPILVDHLNGKVITEDDPFWNDCNQTKTIFINKHTAINPAFLKKDLEKLKNILLVYKGIELLMREGKPEAADKIKELISISSKFYPEIIPNANQFTYTLIMEMKKRADQQKSEREN